MDNKKILVVEDDSSIMEMLSLFLRTEGYSDVLRACTVSQALEILKSTKPKLVFLDYILKTETSEKIIEFIREHYGHEVMIFMLTAIDDPQSKGRVSDADGVIPKPFDLDFLMKTVRHALYSSIGGLMGVASASSLDML